MAEEVTLVKLSGTDVVKWNAILAESDVIARIRPNHIVVQKDKLGSSEVKYVEYQGSVYFCYRLR